MSLLFSSSWEWHRHLYYLICFSVVISVIETLINISLRLILGSMVNHLIFEHIQLACAHEYVIVDDEPENSDLLNALWNSHSCRITIHFQISTLFLTLKTKNWKFNVSNRMLFLQHRLNRSIYLITIQPNSYGASQIVLATHGKSTM